MLITVDVGPTLGSFGKPGTAELLGALGAAPDNAAEIDRNILHVAPELTDEIATLVRERLLIDPTTWPELWATGGFTAYLGTFDALSKLAALGPVVALSNVSVIAGPRRMRDLEEQCGQYMTGIYTSYQLRARKPQPRCWTTIAREHQVCVPEIVHIGDRVPEDIRGALHAGCRAAILTDTRQVAVPEEVLADPRVHIVPDLAAAADMAAELGEVPA